MKYWLYISFLAFVAIVYIRVVENFNSNEFSQSFSRKPASIENEKVLDNEEDIIFKFNPHSLKK